MPETPRIPLYDATAPIACTLAAADVPGRVELLTRLRSAASSVARTPTGMLLRFPAEPATRADLATFTVDEKRCCQFWGFGLTEHGGELVLRWDGPPAVADAVDRLYEWFGSRDGWPADGLLL